MTLSSKVPDSNNKSPIWKKVICVGDKPSAMLVVLHESIVKELAIDDKSPIWKKVICVGDKPSAMLVVLHESIVKELAIDDDTWFEEVLTNQGILLKVSSKKIEGQV